MSRLRSPAQRAPQTKDQAIALLDRYAMVAAELRIIQANRDEALAATNAVADTLAVPLVAELKDIAKQLKPWWAASIDELTGGKRKSITLAGCAIGYRLTPPKVTFAHGKDEDMVAALVGTELEDALVRVRRAPNKEAILDAMGGDQCAALRALGFDVRQTEEFFVAALSSVLPAGGDAADVGDAFVGKGVTGA